MKKTPKSIEESISDKFLRQRNSPAAISKQMASSVSQYRRGILEDEVDKGLFRDGNVMTHSDPMQNRMDPSPAGFVTSNVRGSSLNKMATISSGSGASSPGGWRGSGGTLRQSPDIYSPLWLNSNLNLPRDRATINAWSRAFFALNGLVQNAISLHSTYPISKLNIKCKNPNVEKFFANMIEEIDLMNICVQIAQEYWILGEAFVYAELDEANRKWSRLLIQNPDYIVVQRSVVADEPIISLRPDDNLRRICTSNRPADIAQRQKLDKSIIEHVKRGENIPLNNFYVSHLARKINPYDVRGTGLIVSSFRQLMLMDKLRECYSTDSEVLTDQGFKTIDQLVEVSNKIDVNPNYVVGTEMSEDGKLENLFHLKPGIKIACVDPETNQISYDEPEEFHMSNYTGKMLHFNGKHVDTLVTPNHKMWASKKIGKEYGPYQLIKASDFYSKSLYKFKATVNWVGQKIEDVNVLSTKVPIDVYLKFLGHTISEGCVDQTQRKNGQWIRRIALSQLTESSDYENIRANMEKFAQYISKHICHEIKVRGSGFSKNTPKEAWIGTITCKDLTKYIFDEIGIEGQCDSLNKKIPRWVLMLDKSLLKILMQALVEGDGSEKFIDNELVSYRYFTSSKQLANDVQELAFKCGYSAFISSATRENKNTEYTVRWSDSNIGKEPIVYNNQDQFGVKFEEIDYDGQVWCFTVKTGLFITRRNKRISIHGNSKFSQADNMINPLTLIKVGGGTGEYKPSPADLDAWRQVFEEAQNDKDFKIFTHDAVTVERVGSSSAILDINPDITQLIKEIYTGLMVPSVLMDGGADTTYANGSVALDVLRQRYMQFRNMLTIWLRRKIFAPISKINDFYEYVGEGNSRKKVLIVPDIEWNHMSMFDVDTYINVLTQLATNDDNKRVSLQTLYRSLGLTWEDEVNKIRMEDIHAAIREKEKSSLGTMDLNALRSLGPSDEIQEAATNPLPGEQEDSPTGEKDSSMEGLPGVPSSPPSGEAPPAPETLAPPVPTPTPAPK